MNCHDASRARLLREIRRFGASGEDGLKASVCQAFLRAVKRVGRGAAHRHAKALRCVSCAPWRATASKVPYRRECRRVVLEIRGVEVFLGVVDRHATFNVLRVLAFIP